MIRPLIGVAGVFVLLLVAAIVYCHLVPVEPKDWAAVWTVRWTAVTAIFTGFSWLAIALTALYAHHAIRVNTGIERAKIARELIKEYLSRGIEAARLRCTRAPMPPDYAPESFMGDLDAVITYFEECALYYDSQTSDRELLLRFLDVKTILTWKSLCATAFPHLQQTHPQMGAQSFSRFRTFAVAAQEHVRKRKDMIKKPPALLERLP